ncbi:MULTISPECIES: GGDEF domain-containing phosphodiesterase [unclassified Pseudomonas]|nr:MULTISPECIES: GGDEF domain-containing phosphodiesterase [unclassified Pseudomonas]MEB0079390.1 GGDEF domain-containing phosphodiesterase [Pseudomonas sp. MH10out]MEB0132411.1 GGDEF domain-containing phosphodiesterase [Pseudomonas sp. CCI2.4]MEB0159693.1 GGDEF domain-containing phosphodiesterase [Pseudomonas sp. AH2 (2023)]MEB0169099.1 GGDEF domain-containing phosphodiesterase [Pseudomonas sp. CCC4.4]WPX27608.1 GGDEF domain-containing phosphodiesterase [Pseudomonas sp. AH2]
MGYIKKRTLGGSYGLPSIFNHWIPDISPRIRRLGLAVILLSYLAASTHLYLAGGVRLGYPSLMMVPVLLASLLFGVPGVLPSALPAALLITALGSQFSDGAVWVTELPFRSLLYVLIGMMVAIPIHIYAFYSRKLNYVMRHDPGTGLPGRRALFETLDQVFKSPLQLKTKNGLAVISINNIHDISHTFGYEAADTLIAALWEQLIDAFESHATVYHYNRDCLAVLFFSSDENLTKQTRTVECIFERSIIYEGLPIHFDAHIGYARLSGDDRREVVNRAESASEYAREMGMRSALYTSAMALDKRQNLILMGGLLDALHSAELTLHFQPKINLKTGQLVGFEALSRWQHPTLGNVPPDRFIPLIERTALIHAFSLWAIETALIKFNSFRKQGVLTVVAVNLSSHNLINDEFPKQVIHLLDKYNVDSCYLEFEITESEIMRNPEKAIEVLKELSGMPISISIDDFGTGYSSLAYLHKLPATQIKIDRSFIQDINHDSGLRKIVSAAIVLAHSLGMKVVAEGVETEDQYRLLERLGCDSAQGYLIARPMPEDQILKWFEQWVAPSLTADLYEA